MPHGRVANQYKFPTLWARLMAWCVVDQDQGLEVNGVWRPCWTWTGTRGGRGNKYPRINVYNKDLRRNDSKRAHRVVAELVGGAHPYDTVEHACQNTLCIHPNHLFWMSLEDNARDANNRRWDNEHSAAILPLRDPDEENPFSAIGMFYHPSEPVPF